MSCNVPKLILVTKPESFCQSPHLPLLGERVGAVHTDAHVCRHAHAHTHTISSSLQFIPHQAGLCTCFLARRLTLHKTDGGRPAFDGSWKEDGLAPQMLLSWSEQQGWSRRRWVEDWQRLL